MEDKEINLFSDKIYLSYDKMFSFLQVIHYCKSIIAA